VGFKERSRGTGSNRGGAGRAHGDTEKDKGNMCRTLGDKGTN
jgi:hypothetical protein